MAGLAQLAATVGHRVSGCDSNIYPPMSDQLTRADIVIYDGYEIKQLDLRPDLYVIGNVISRGNALLEAILERNLAYTSGPQWLSEHILYGRWVLAVAGTHGKTTTTSLLAWILEYAGLQPSFLVGGVPLNFLTSARLNNSDFFVLEADEYDTAFCDKRSKFLHYRPRTLVLNNLEYDHADIFPDLNAIELQFHHLIRTIPSNGRIICNAEDITLQRVLERGCWTPIDWFNDSYGWMMHTSSEPSSEPGSSPHPYPVEQRKHVVTYSGKEQGTACLDLSGNHNQSNAIAAIAAAFDVGVSVEVALEALMNFKGIKRRMELLGVVRGISVYDDFAHHPTEIAAALSGLRQQLNQSAGRILAVIEPRSNTMKLGLMAPKLADSLADAELIFCYTNQINWDVAAALSSLGDRVVCSDQISHLVSSIVNAAQPGDHLVVMSNGSFATIHTRLLEELEEPCSA